MPELRHMRLKVPHILSNLLIGVCKATLSWQQEAEHQASEDSRRKPAAKMASAQQDTSNVSANPATVENAYGQASNPGEDEWDEEKLEKAMNTLKEMHIQVGTQDQLRWAYC